MKWAYVDGNNIMQNNVEYDGVSQVTPPNGWQLVQVGDWNDIGQAVTDTPPVVALTTQQKNDAVYAQLDTIDAASVRPLRAVLNALQSNQTPNPTDVAKLALHDQQAAALRGTLIS